MYTFNVFNNDMKLVKQISAPHSKAAIRMARRPWLPNPIVENETLMKKNPDYKPTEPLEFVYTR